MIEGHGDDLYRYGDKIRHNFSSNIFQTGNQECLKRYLADRLDIIANYPEPVPYSIECILADSLGVPSDCVMVTNGAVDAIHIVARSLAQHTESKSAVLQPTFAEYADACALSGHEVVSFTDINRTPSDASAIWICNPNNPTGTVYDTGILMHLLESQHTRMVIIDQAYHKYTKCEVMSPCRVLDHDNLVLLYSMTKDYAIPGLRLGYVVANAEIIATLSRYRTPWSVNAVAIEGAKYLLKSDTEMSDTDMIDYLLTEAERVRAAFADLGIEVHPSDTNFMLCRLPMDTAANLKEYLVAEHGILIRDASNFEGLTPAHFRVAVQRRYEDDILIEAIRQWLSNITNHKLRITN